MGSSVVARTPFWISTLVVSLVGAPLFAPPVAADDAPPLASDATKAAALLAEGVKLRAKGDDARALERFEAADALAPSPLTGLESARALARVGKLLEARARLLQALDRPDVASNSDAAKSDARALLVELETWTPKVNLHLRHAPSDLQFFVDDAPVDRYDIRANPGKHRIVAKNASIERHVDVVLEKSERGEVVLDFAPPVESTVESTEMAWTTSSDEAPRPKPRIFTVAVFGIAGAGLVTGVVLGVIAKTKASHLDTVCVDHKCAPEQRDAVASYRHVATGATVSFVVGGVGAMIGLVSMLVIPAGGEGSSTARV